MSDTKATAQPESLGIHYQPLEREQLANPYPFYAAARHAEPVFFAPVFGMWFVTRYADIVSVLRDPATFSSRDTIPTHPEMDPRVQAVISRYRHPQHLINSDPPAHTRFRALVGSAFTPQRVHALEPAIHRVAHQLIDGFADRGSADLIEEMAYPLPLTVILQMIGVPAGDMDSCRQWSFDISTWAWGAATLPVEQLVDAATGMVAFQDYTEALVAERRRAPRDDMISALLEPNPEFEPLSDEELVALLPGLILAGHETTANLIGNTVWHLLATEGCWPQVRDDPAMVTRAVEEGLRADTSTNGMIRTTTRDVELAGVALPAGTRLFLLFGSANHDEHEYAEPEQFRLSRPPREPPHLAFGRGIHFCVGAPLARLETRIAIERLAHRLSGLRLVPGQDLQHRPLLLFRGLEHLELAWDRPAG